MKVVALVDNMNNAEKNLEGEHGLSVYIEYGNEKILLDSGTTDLYLKNAQQLGVSLEEINMAVLSHAHYDHSGGFESFFAVNDNAGLYMQKSCKENCFRIPGKMKAHGDIDVSDLTPQLLKYIGIPLGLLKKNSHRICYVDGDRNILPGIWLIAHHTVGLWEKGKKAGMCRMEEQSFIYDDFSHEQSLVAETQNGLVIFNSCCHGGPDAIITEVLDRPCFKGKTVYALFGGFHLKDLPDSKEGDAFVENLAKKLLDSGVRHFYTGHCTGEKAFSQLADILGDRLHYFKTGDLVEIQ